jgi:hypothetical protein
MILPERTLHSSRKKLAREISPILTWPKRFDPLNVHRRQSRRIVIMKIIRRLRTHCRLISRARRAVVAQALFTAPDHWKIANGFANRDESIKLLGSHGSIGHQVAYAEPAVGGNGKSTPTSGLVLSPRYEKHSPSHLRDAVLRGKQLGTIDAIPEFVESFANLVEQHTSREGRQPRHVLDHGDFGKQFPGDPKKLSEQLVAWVVQQPLPQDAETLAGRAANQDIKFAAAEPGLSQYLLTCDLADIRETEWNVGKVVPMRPCTGSRPVRGQQDVKSGAGETKRQSARTGKQVDGGRALTRRGAGAREFILFRVPFHNRSPGTK